MANAGVETSRIRDVDRNSKILRDVPLKPNLKFDSFITEPDRYSEGLRHNGYYDTQLVDGVFPHVGMAEVDGCCYHRSGAVRERNQSWFRSILPTFDGSPIIEEFWEWVDSIEDYFEETQPPERLKCKIASYTLEDEAEVWWDQLQRDRVEEGKLKIYSWARMKRLLAKEFLHYRCSRKVPSEYKGVYVRSDSEKPKQFSATNIISSANCLRNDKPPVFGYKLDEMERKSRCEDVAEAHSYNDELATKGTEKLTPHKCSTEVLLESCTHKHEDDGFQSLEKSKPLSLSIEGAIEHDLEIANLVDVCVDESETEQDLNVGTEYNMIEGLGKKIHDVTETRNIISITVLDNTLELKGISVGKGHINSSQLVAKAKCTESYQQEPLYTPGFASYEVQKVKLLARNFVESSSLLSSNKNYTDPLYMDAFMFDPGGKFYLSGNCEEVILENLSFAQSEEDDLVLVKRLSVCDEKSLGNEPMFACDKVLIREFIAFKVFLVIQRCCEPSFNMLRSKDASSITRTGGCRKLGEEGSHWLVIQNLEAVDGSSDRKDVKQPGVVLAAFNQDGASSHHSTRSNLLRGNISPWLHTVIDFGSSVFILDGYCKPICIEFAKFKLDQSKESITGGLEAKGSSNKGQTIVLQEGFDPTLVDLKHAVVSISREFSFNARDLPYFPNVPTPRPLFRCVILFGGTLSYLFDPGGNRQSMKILLIGLMVVRSALIPWLSPHSTLTFKFGVQQVVKNQNLTVAVCLKLGHIIVFIADNSVIPMVEGILLQGDNVGNIAGMGYSLFSSFPMVEGILLQGDNVGNIAGMGYSLFSSFAESSSLNLHSSNWEFLSFVYNRDEDLLTNITCILYSMGCLLDIHQSLLHNSPRIFVTTVEFPFDPGKGSQRNTKTSYSLWCERETNSRPQDDAIKCYEEASKGHSKIKLWAYFWAVTTSVLLGFNVTFAIVYTKTPNLLVDYKSKATRNLTQSIQDMHAAVKEKLEQTNKSYKQNSDAHRLVRHVGIGDLVMVLICKERFIERSCCRHYPYKAPDQAPTSEEPLEDEFILWERMEMM